MARSRQSHRSTIVVSGLALVAFAAMLRRHWGYGMLGADSFPILLTSRVHDFRDVLGNFTERLMDGRYPGGFWRPVLNWSFAVDEWIWGLEPFGFQLTNVLLWTVCGLALWCVVRHVSGSGWTAVVASAVYYLHPVHVEVLPVPARRSEYLCAIFMLAALALARRAPVLAGVATLAAIGSKETALVLPALVFVAARLESGTTKRALHAALPSAIAAAAMFAARTAVLGGIGGHGSLATDPLALGRMVEALVVPQPVPGSILIVALVVLGASVAAWLAVESRRADGASGAQASAGLALAWLAVAGVMYMAAGEAYWQRLLPAIGWAMVVAAAAHACAVALRGEIERVFRVAAVVTIAAAALLVGWHAAYSPIIRDYGEWKRGSRALVEFLDETRAAIRDGADGSAIQAPPIPYWADPSPEGPVACSAIVLMIHSVQAWTELALPDRNVRVVSIEDFARRPGPDELQLMVSGRREGFKGLIAGHCAGPHPYRGFRPR